MALKTIESYNEAKDYTFSPIEDADYSETNVRQDYNVINTAKDKAINVLGKFLNVSNEILTTLEDIKNKGIWSTELEIAFARTKNYMTHAVEEVENSNGEFIDEINTELAEIEAANKAAVAVLETAGAYGEYGKRIATAVGNSIDHSEKATKYFKDILSNNEASVIAAKAIANKGEITVSDRRTTIADEYGTSNKGNTNEKYSETYIDGKKVIKRNPFAGTEKKEEQTEKTKVSLNDILIDSTVRIADTIATEGNRFRDEVNNNYGK